MSGARLVKRRRGRRVDETGRSIGPPRFLKLEHWLLKTAAWCSLPPASRALYVAIAQRYNGSNNGEISMSVREAACLIHVAKDTAGHSFRELEEKGFLKRNLCGSFNWKRRHATTWILTEHPLGDEPATKEFARWCPEKSEAGPNVGTTCPNKGPRGGRFRQMSRLPVPELGPSARFCTVPRSQTAAHIYSAMPCATNVTRLGTGRRPGERVETMCIAARSPGRHSHDDDPREAMPRQRPPAG